MSYLIANSEDGFSHDEAHIFTSALALVLIEYRYCLSLYVYRYYCFRVFATNICDKISEMINSIATPVDLKLSLVPILKHMYHDVDMVSKVSYLTRYLR